MHYTTLVIVNAFLFLAQLGCMGSSSIPSTNQVAMADESSNKKVYKYPSGSIKLVEQYENKVPLQSTWYLPDGSLFRQTVWENGTGTGYYLDNEGRLTAEIFYVNNVASGRGYRISYLGQDAVIVEVNYKDGVALKK